jgi:hypothetical protein
LSEFIKEYDETSQGVYIPIETNSKGAEKSGFQHQEILVMLYIKLQIKKSFKNAKPSRV